MKSEKLLQFIIAAALLAVFCMGCESTEGEPLDSQELGLSSCELDEDCGVGRYCTEGHCQVDCLEHPDCSYLGSDLACNAHGRCLPDPCEISCSEHVDCGEGGYCNKGLGLCAPFCRDQGDCVEAIQKHANFADYCGDKELDECMVCSAFGVCIAEDGNDSCTSHDDCGPDRFCNVNVGLCAPFCNGRADCFDYCAATGECRSDCEALAACEAINMDEEQELCCDDPGEQLECTEFRQCVEKAVLQLPEDDPNYIDQSDLGKLLCPSFDSVCASKGFGFSCSPSKVCEGNADEVDFGEVDENYAASNYVGIWGILTVTATISAEVPIYGVQRVYSYRLELARITHDKDDLKWERKICSLDVANFSEDGSPVQSPSRILSPPNYIRALGIVPNTISDVKAITAGTVIRSEPIFEVRGWTLENPSSSDYDNMPNKDTYLAGDSRIYDQDLDGRPGMTNIMDGLIRGEIYNVSMMRYQYDGKVVDEDHIAGYILQFKNVINNFDASKEILIQNVATSQHPDQERTYFRMMRIPDSSSCSDVIEMASISGHWLSKTYYLDDVDVSGTK